MKKCLNRRTSWQHIIVIILLILSKHQNHSFQLNYLIQIQILALKCKTKTVLSTYFVILSFKIYLYIVFVFNNLFSAYQCYISVMQKSTLTTFFGKFKQNNKANEHLWDRCKGFFLGLTLLCLWTLEISGANDLKSRRGVSLQTLLS